MKKWICKVCGYTYHGMEAPLSCPRCGAPRFQFRREGRFKGETFGVIVTILLIVVVSYAVYSCSTSLTVDNSVVKEVNLTRYLGKWYEIARFDHRFERDMQECTADYTMQPDGKIKVTNQGRKNGKWKQSVGTAKLTDKPGVLRVSFFRPFYSDYRILMLAPDYSYALVGGDSDKYLWILSRKPKLSRAIQDKLVSEAQRRGYDTGKLIWVEH